MTSDINKKDLFSNRHRLNLGVGNLCNDLQNNTVRSS